MKHRSIRRMASDSILTLVMIGVGLLLSEVTLRTLDVNLPVGGRWFAGSVHPRGMVEEDGPRGYILRSGFRGSSESPDGHFRVDIAIHEHGLRDHPHRSGERARVLMIGDSITFGQGVRAEDAYPALVESALREERVLVRNAGVPGYSTRQMAEHIRRLAPGLQPDLVTVAFDPVWDRDRLERPFTCFQGFIVKSGLESGLVLVDDKLRAPDLGWPVIGPLTAHAQGHSRVYQVVRRGLQGGVRLLRDLRGPGAPQDEPLDPGEFSAVLESVSRLRDLAVETELPLIVILLEARSPARRELNVALAHRVRSEGIPLVLLDELLPQGQWEEWNIPNDGHWNEQGHRAVAAALAPVIGEAIRSGRE